MSKLKEMIEKLWGNYNYNREALYETLLEIADEIETLKRDKAAKYIKTEDEVLKPKVRFATYKDALESLIKQIGYRHKLDNCVTFIWLCTHTPDLSDPEIDTPYITLSLTYRRDFKALTKKRCIEKAFEYYGWEV